MSLSFDAFTISAIIVVLILFVFVIATVRASEKRMEEKLRRAVEANKMLIENEKARELCREIQKEHPDACPGVDFTLKQDGDEVCVDKWYKDTPPPSHLMRKKGN